jgi:hypothetical protein
MAFIGGIASTEGMWREEGAMDGGRRSKADER